VAKGVFHPRLWGVFFMLAFSAGTVHGFCDASLMRPPVEPPRIETLLDSMLVLGDPGRGLTRFVEDSANTSEERLHAATLLASYHNRKEEPARALLALFYIRRETGEDWSPEQSLIAAEAYARLGHRDWSEASLDRIPYTHSLTEVAQVLRVYGAFEKMKDPDSLVEIRSRFERQLERCSDPMALMLSLHGLGLCYIAKGTAAAYDTAAALLSLAMDDTAAAYLSFATKGYRKYSQEIPLVKRLLPYSLYWSGRAATRSGNGWIALQAYEEILNKYPEAIFWDEAVVQYGALQLKRHLTDSVRFAANLLLKRSREPYKLLQARLLLASAMAYEAEYDSAAAAFASLARSIEIGDTLRVLSRAGMTASLLRYSESIEDPDSIAVRLAELDLSGYNPLAIPQINSEIAERFLIQRRIDEAESFFARTLRYYPNPGTETRARLALAYISLAKGEYTSSIANYEKVLELVDRYGFSFDGLADVQLSLGLAYLQRSRSEDGNGLADLRRARSSFREALALDPKGETGDAARRQLENID